MEESPTTDDRTRQGLGRVILVLVVAGLAAWSIALLRGPWWLPATVFAGVVAGAVALGLWTPGPLRQISERNRSGGWLLPRLVVAAVALAVITAPYPLSSPECPAESDLDESGPLRYARLNGTTLVCVYEYTGMGLEL